MQEYSVIKRDESGMSYELVPLFKGDGRSNRDQGITIVIDGVEYYFPTLEVQTLQELEEVRELQQDNTLLNERLDEASSLTDDIKELLDTLPDILEDK